MPRLDPLGASREHAVSEGRFDGRGALCSHVGVLPVLVQTSTALEISGGVRLSVPAIGISRPSSFEPRASQILGLARMTF
jgi:hypothetical protein